MKKTLRLALVGLLAMSMLVGCGGAANSAQSTTNTKPADTAQTTDAAAGDKDITIAVEVDFTTMDPADTNDTLSGGIQRMIMDGLFGFDGEMKVIPLLATEYTANDTATEFTLKLREGVEFTDGTPWNAEAAIANLDRLADQTQGLKRNSLFKIIDHTEKISDYEIKIVLNEPFGAMINTLAHPAGVMVSPAALKEYGKEVSQHPVGTGMYKFVEWRPGESLKLEKNEKYWGGEVGFDSVTFKPVTESGTRVSMLQAGDADAIFPVPTESIEILGADATIKVQEAEGLVVRYLMMNTTKAPYNDVKVRQAINYAIDKEAYNQVVYNGHATPTQSIIAPAVQFYKANEAYAYDVEKAKALLAEAGYPNGFETTLWCNNTTANAKQAQFLQQQLGLAGIKVNIEAMENGTLQDKVTGIAAGTKGEDAGVELYMIGWSPSTGDADWGMRPLAAAESFPPTSYNISYYNNPAFDEQIYAGLKTADPEKRKEAYAKAQDIIWQDAPMAWLVVQHTTIALKDTVTGISIYPDGALNLTQGKMAK